jgi:hypothetical protein
MYYPCLSFLSLNHWLPAAKPRLFKDVGVELIASEETSPNRWKLLFRVQGKSAYWA